MDLKKGDHLIKVTDADQIAELKKTEDVFQVINDPLPKAIPMDGEDAAVAYMAVFQAID